MSHRRIRTSLSTLGVSAPAVEAYLAVLGRDRVPVAEAVADVDLAGRDGADVLAELADRGLVSLDDDQATVRPRPPPAAVAALANPLDGLEDALSAADVDGAAGPKAGLAPGVEDATDSQRVAAALVDAAEGELFVSLSPAGFEALAPALSAAVNRGVFVYCLLAGEGASEALAGVEDPAAYALVVRTWDNPAPVYVVRDVEAGLVDAHSALGGEPTGERATAPDEYTYAFHHPEAAGAFHGNLLSNYWPMGTEAFVAEPPALPATFEDPRKAVTTAAIYQRADAPLVADVDGRDLATGESTTLDTVPVREVRQSVVEPTNAAFPIENSLVVETDGGLISVGTSPAEDIGPFYEEVGADAVRLEEA